MSEHDVWETSLWRARLHLGEEPNHFLMSCRNLLPKSAKLSRSLMAKAAMAYGWLRRGLTITEEERDMHEGAAHSGMSAVIGLTARKSA